MTIAIGTDIVEIKRIAEVIDRQGDRFVHRLLCEAERLEYQRLNQSVQFLAKRFAAKEAVSKALGTGIGHGVSFQDIVVTSDNRGAPLVELSAGAAEVMHSLGGSRVLLSLSDERLYALAFALLV